MNVKTSILSINVGIGDKGENKQLLKKINILLAQHQDVQTNPEALVPPCCVSVLQFSSRLTRTLPDVCQTQRCPSLVVSSPEICTKCSLLLSAGGVAGLERGLSCFTCCCSASVTRRTRRSSQELCGRTLMSAEET